MRVFTWNEGDAEDPVCGSASSFASKYWTTRANIRPGEELMINHVSARGGEIGVVWNQASGTAFLRGYTRVASRGEIYI